MSIFDNNDDDLPDVSAATPSSMPIFGPDVPVVPLSPRARQAKRTADAMVDTLVDILVDTQMVEEPASVEAPVKRCRLRKFTQPSVFDSSQDDAGYFPAD